MATDFEQYAQKKLANLKTQFLLNTSAENNVYLGIYEIDYKDYASEIIAAAIEQEQEQRRTENLIITQMLKPYDLIRLSKLIQKFSKSEEEAEQQNLLVKIMQLTEQIARSIKREPLQNYQPLGLEIFLNFLEREIITTYSPIIMRFANEAGETRNKKKENQENRNQLRDEARNLFYTIATHLTKLTHDSQAEILVQRASQKNFNTLFIAKIASFKNNSAHAKLSEQATSSSPTLQEKSYFTRMSELQQRIATYCAQRKFQATIATNNKIKIAENTPAEIQPETAKHLIDQIEAQFKQFAKSKNVEVQEFKNTLFNHPEATDEEKAKITHLKLQYIMILQDLVSTMQTQAFTEAQQAKVNTLLDQAKVSHLLNAKLGNWFIQRLGKTDERKQISKLEQGAHKQQKPLRSEIAAMH